MGYVSRSKKKKKKEPNKNDEINRDDSLQRGKMVFFVFFFLTKEYQILGNAVICYLFFSLFLK